MKRIFITTMLLGFGLLFNHCEDDNMLPNPSNCSALTSTTDQTTGDPYFILDATIESDCLNVIVQYSGGCEEHDLELRWSGIYGQSNPLTAFLTLWHHGNGDQCEAFLTDSLHFDLTTIQAEAENTVKIQVREWGEEVLIYEY